MKSYFDKTRKAKTSLAGLGVGLLLVWGGLLSASAVAAPDNATSVTLGDVAGLPKTQVMVPLYLTPNPPTKKVGRISGTITFENKGVTFLKAEKGIILQGVNGTFDVRIQEDPKNAGLSLINFEISSGSGERLREGVLLFLTFSIKGDASPDVDIPLKLQDVKLTDGEDPPHPVQPLTSKNGTIDVIVPEEVPYTSCFFFSH